MDRRLKEYVPSFLQEYKELSQIYETQEPEIQTLWKETDILSNNQYILSADPKGIMRFEKLLGIKTFGTIEERRQKIYFEWNKQVVYTERTLYQLMENYLGCLEFNIKILTSEYAIKFLISTKISDIVDLEVKLREIIPANLIIQFELVRNGTIKQFFSYMFASQKRQTYFPFSLENIEVMGILRHGIHYRENKIKKFTLEGMGNTKKEGVFYFDNYIRKYVQKRMEVERN